MFCDTNWVVVLIRFLTTNVLLALISKSVVEPRRIHFTKVSESGHAVCSKITFKLPALIQNFVPYLLG